VVVAHSHWKGHIRVLWRGVGYVARRAGIVIRDEHRRLVWAFVGGVLTVRPNCDRGMLGPGNVETAQVRVQSNNAFERAVERCGPRLAAAEPSWPAAQLGR